MKKITWDLPFKTMDYLESLTTLLANNPLVVLIVGIQNSEEIIDSCNIHIRDIGGDMNELHLHLGALLGSHATAYGFMQAEEESGKGIDAEKAKVVPEDPDLEEQEEVIEEQEWEENFKEEVVKEKIEEEDEILKIKGIKTKDLSPARKLLRKLLENFKKH